MTIPRDRTMACPTPELWPAADRQAWFAPQQAGAHSPFRKNGAVRALSPASMMMLVEGYGRFLTYLTQHRPELLALSPDKRPTQDVVDGYFQHLADAGYARRTMIEAMESVRRTLRRMYPGRDFAHVTRPFGVSVREHLPLTGPTRWVPHEDVLYDCARKLFEEAPQCLHRVRRHARSRDAAILGVLTDIAPRLRTLTALELGKHVRCVDGIWWVYQTPEITKTGPRTGRSLDMPLSPEVSQWLDHYITCTRAAAMARTQPHDRLWVNAEGRPFSRICLETAVAIRTRNALGHALRPHAFRRVLATSDALSGDDHPLDASARLGHASPVVTLRHYNLAKAHAAGRRHADRIEQMLKDLRKREEQ